jgi:hypothetical protein
MAEENAPNLSLRSSSVRYDDPFAPVDPEPPETLRLDGDLIRTWNEFHSQCAAVFGIPEFYGRNLDAWIDCVSDMRSDSRMTKFRLASGQVLQIELADSGTVRTVAPEIFSGFLDVVMAVNQRGRESGYGPLVSLVLV